MFKLGIKDRKRKFVQQIIMYNERENSASEIQPLLKMTIIVQIFLQSEKRLAKARIF
jgi:hypothetical protein